MLLKFTIYAILKLLKVFLRSSLI